MMITKRCWLLPFAILAVLPASSGAQDNATEQGGSIRAWIELLRESDATRSLADVVATEKTAANATDAISTLIDALNDSDPHVFLAAEFALEQIGASYEEERNQFDAGVSGSMDVRDVLRSKNPETQVLREPVLASASAAPEWRLDTSANERSAEPPSLIVVLTGIATYLVLVFAACLVIRSLRPHRFPNGTKLTQRPPIRDLNQPKNNNSRCPAATSENPRAGCDAGDPDAGQQQRTSGDCPYDTSVKGIKSQVAGFREAGRNDENEKKPQSGMWRNGQASKNDKLARLKADLKNGNEEIRRRAAMMLSEMGVAAIPALLKALDDEDQGICHAATTALSGIGLAAVPFLLQPQKESKLAVSSFPSSIADLVDIGRNPSRDTLQSLENRDSSVRARAASALGAKGPVAVPYLVKLLGDEDSEVRRRAVAALGRIGPSARVAMSRMANLLDDDDLDVRRSTTSAFGSIGLVATPALFKALDDDDEEVRQRAKSALSGVGLAVIPSLAESLDDADGEIRRQLEMHPFFRDLKAA